MKTIAMLLLFAALASADDTAKLVDQLFHADEAKRAAARSRILSMGEDGLAKVLDRIEVRQKQAERVMQIYAVKDLAIDSVLWPLTRKQLGELDAVVREQDSGVLVVLATRKVHTAIADILGKLRERLTHVVTISGAIVQLGDGMAVPKGFEPGAFEKWVSENKVVVKPLPKLTCRNGERVEVTAMRRVSYVAEFDVELACGAWIADPVVDTLPSGLSLNVRAIAGKRIDLHIDLRSAQLTEPLKEADVPMPVGKPLRIQAPESRSVHIRTSRSVASDSFTVVDLGEGRIVVIGAASTSLAE